MVVADFTEQELIARVRAALPQAPPWLLIGIGDDAAVVEPERNRVDVFTVDAIVEGVHFDRRFTPPAAIGHRALAVNLSDLAAMGASPRLALLSMALPPELPCADFDALIGGLVQLAGAHKVHLVGGNLTRISGPLVVDVTAAGTAKRRGVLVRSGARPGDEIYVTGTIGAAAAGLQILKSGMPRAGRAGQSGDATAGRGACAPEADAVRRYLFPEPRVRTGVLLGRNRAASACMDLSDGLADAVSQVAEASGVGAILDAAALPIHAAARACFAGRGEDELIGAAAASDDYELLVTVRPRSRGRLLAARSGGAPFTRIGVCTAERDVRLRWTDGAATRDTPLPSGFGHFR
jgi:thiamine-monophosphate kinase